MRLLLLSDIHSDFEKLEIILKEVEFDVVFVAGDFTHFRPSDVFKADEILSKYASLCYAVHGNCDHEQVLQHRYDVITFIHCRSVPFEDYTLHGIGGSGFTPFNTPSEYSEDEMKGMVEKLNLGERNILLSHCPPKGTLDRTYSGIHAGCGVIRDFAEHFDVILCGHIHEAHGIERNPTLAVNPGPAMWGRYALINLETLEVELKKIS